MRGTLRLGARCAVGVVFALVSGCDDARDPTRAIITVRSDFETLHWSHVSEVSIAILPSVDYRTEHPPDGPRKHILTVLEESNADAFWYEATATAYDAEDEEVVLARIVAVSRMEKEETTFLELVLTGGCSTDEALELAPEDLSRRESDPTVVTGCAGSTPTGDAGAAER